MITLLSWLFTCALISLHTTVEAISFRCPDSEKSLLLGFKRNVTFDHSSFSKLPSWNETSDCCVWEGVSCDLDGHVSGLNLNSGRISGTFPGEIFQIPKLQSIDLSNNEFLRGTLPDFSVNSSLQQLHLYNTKFSGGLPLSIGNLRNLSSLKLSKCLFEGPLPSSIEKLTRLKFLFLSGNGFSGPIPSLRLFSDLVSIDLSGNRLYGTIASLRFEGLSKLRYLSLSGNFLNGSIPSSLFKLPSLTGVDFSNNGLGGPFPVSAFESGNLTSLDLSHNEFSGTVQLNAFRGFSQLRFLDLSYNRLSVETGDRTLTSFPRVSQLHLASCDLKEFPRFENQSNLFFLDLSSNGISGEIPNWVWEIGGGSLSVLNLSYNSLSGIQEPYSLHRSLGVIDLHSNRLKGRVPFPPLADYADFSGNNFSSVQTDVFNGSNYLGFFSLSRNSLTGVLPQSVCNLNRARVFGGVLDLSRNNLSGEITRCAIEAGISLNVLNLRGNEHVGPIPDRFPIGCSLKTVDLNGNSISGEIPRSLANCDRLEVLDLGNNELTGGFPCFLKNISTLQVLILRSNRLTGDIQCRDYPNGTWPVLQILDLARNGFEGELVRVKWLEDLQAMKNETYGAQSTTLGATHYFTVVFPNQVAYLQPYYQYTVTTVTSKGQERELPKILTIFTFLDLSSNKFRGKIPEEFGHLRALHTLSLSDNALSGEIPSSIGDLRALESLDLSLNDLAGKIPESLGDLNFLQFLNLSFNRLVGEVPKGSQIQTFSEDSFLGNEGLCGFPLKKSCSGKEAPDQREEGGENSNIDWNFLSAEIGFIVGLGVVVAPIVFLRNYRMMYFDRIDDIIIRIFPSAVARKWVLWTTA